MSDAAVALDAPAIREAGPAAAPADAAAHAAAHATPAWFSILEVIHGGTGWAAAVADLLVVAIAALFAGTAPLTGILLAALVVVGFGVGGVYAPRSPLETQGVLWYLSRVAAPFAVTCAGVLLVVGEARHSHRLLAALVTIGVTLVVLRVATWTAVARARRAGVGLRRTVVVGTGSAVRAVVEGLRRNPEAGLLPVAQLEAKARDGIASLPADLPEQLERWAARDLVLVADGEHDVDLAGCVALCHGLPVDLAVWPPLGQMLLRPGFVSQVAGRPLVTIGNLSGSRPFLVGKRLFDILAATAMLLLLTPLLLLTALAIKLGDRGTVLFRQKRVGYRGTEFTMFKFRTMVPGAEQLVVSLRDRNAADGLLFKIESDPRITRAGRLLRRFSIDELPQLWNVLRGDMSLVGPRPLPVRPDDFGPIDSQRHNVPPGITGYWQVTPGDGLTYRDMVRLDLAYVQGWSLWLDLVLLARTLPSIVRRSRGPIY
ncbi:MAG: Undecaprenyl-phosphate galactose phosphotransferase [Acidimicrobiales bacterium]|jgi:exopolysaccharide biosynthesis polyprenyl glycosylphosphotransferase|nr:Undecaprenyl-phosphate galactose phosphotransferase [Acidimicrobiales bacterium]